jgi:hypothetical protein
MWWFRNGGASYNIYRHTSNNVGSATKIVSAAAYTDPNTGGYIDYVAAGTYYYWVENSGGLNKVALNTNSTGGLSVAACPCTFTINPTASNFTNAGGSGTVTVTASVSSCAWTATPNVAWLHVTSGSSGTGNVTVAYVVDSYTGVGVHKRLL